MKTFLKGWWLWPTFFFVISCSTARKDKAPATHAPASAVNSYKIAMKEWETGKRQQAVRRLQQILNDHRGTDVYNDSAYFLGQIASQQKDFNKSYDYFALILKSNTSYPKENDAALLAARAAYRAGRVPESLAAAEGLIARLPADDPKLPEAHIIKALINELDHKYIDSLNSLVAVTASHANKQEQEKARTKAIDLVENKLSQEDLETVSRDSNFGFIRGYALFRLAERATEAKDKDQARRYYRSVVDYLPGSELAERATRILNEMDSGQKTSPFTVGVVLPLTGKYASLAQKTLRGIQMGFGLNGAGSPFRIAVIDSEANYDTARKGVEKLVAEDNAIAIIGSLLSKTSTAVAARSQELGVPNIALSQKSGLTEIGDTVFRNAVTSEMLVREVVRVSMEDLGYKKFAVLYPNDAYGTEYANLFWDEVLARGGSIRGAQIYSNKETDFRNPIQRLAGLFYFEERVDEYNLRLKDWQKNQAKRTTRNQPPEDLLPPVIDFEAIFVPDSVKALGQIASMLAFNNVRNVKLLGTNLWNTPSVVKRAGNFSDNLIFVDSTISTPSLMTNSKFFTDYKESFGEEPGIFELQGYDSASLLRQLIMDGARTRNDLKIRLSGMDKINTATGALVMTKDREIERPVVALTVSNGQVIPYNQAGRKNP